MKLNLLLADSLFASVISLKVELSYEQYPKEKVLCEAKFGTYKKIKGQYYCVNSHSDAFKSCTSSSQCTGGCIVEDQNDPIGFCRPDNNPTAYFATIL